MPKNTTPEQPDEQPWFPDEKEIQLVCPTCGSDDFMYAGEAYDDDQYLGSSYDCQECGRAFTMMDYFEDGD